MIENIHSDDEESISVGPGQPRETGHCKQSHMVIARSDQPRARVACTPTRLSRPYDSVL